MENIPKLTFAMAKTVRVVRSKAGLTQAQLADFAGLSRIYIAQLETGDRRASLNALILIAKSVGMTTTDLVALIEQEISGLNKD